MLALELCRSGATDQEILEWLDQCTPDVRRQSVEELQHLERNGTGDMDDETITIAWLCVAGDPEETFELICYQRPVERRDLVRQLMHRRTPTWCNRFATIASSGRGSTWWLIQLLVREGLAERPGGRYLIRMVHYLVTHPYYATDGPRLAAALRADPELMEAEVWEVLAMPWRLSDAWVSALVELADEDLRDRLLDAAWRALIADRGPAQQNCFLNLLKQLKPSASELSSRLAGLLRMTASEHGPVVLWSLSGLRDLLEAGGVAVDDLLVVRAPLQRRDKRTALVHLALLEKAAKRFPSRRAEIGETVAIALDHERRDVRERAQRVLERVAPDAPKPTPAEVHAVEVEPLTRPAPTAFEPLQSADQLVELLLTLMATPGSAVDVERAFDAAVRFKDEITESGRTALDQGSRAGSGQAFPAFGAHSLAQALIQPPSSSLGDPSWTESIYDTDSHSPDVGERSLNRMTQLRLEQICKAIQSPITELLSTPTSNDGTLGLEALRARLHATQGEPAFRSDVGTAAFRIAPQEYGALDTLRFSIVGRAIADDVVRISRHRHQLEAVTGRPDCLWREAAEPAPSNEFVGSVLGTQPYMSRHASDSLTASWSLLLPHHRELHAAHVFPVVKMTAHDDRSIFGQLILSLGEGRQVTGPVAASALGCALSAKCIQNRGAAIDVVIELTTYGLLDGAELGRQIVWLLAGNRIHGARTATALAEAGRALGPRSGPVLDAHVSVLPALLPSLHRRDGHIFAETTADLATSLGRRIALPPEMADLAAGRSSTVLARALRRIPQPT